MEVQKLLKPPAKLPKIGLGYRRLKLVSTHTFFTASARATPQPESRTREGRSPNRAQGRMKLENWEFTANL
jgi:hypothetical protein